jgi:hypothetical protein
MIQVLSYLKKDLVSAAVSAEAGLAVAIPVLRGYAEGEYCCEYESD